MSRLVFPLIAVVLSLLPVVAPAEPVQKRPAPRWHGYGFLPGYQQPPNDTIPPYAQKASTLRMARRNQRPWYIDPVPAILRVRWRLALFRPARLLRRSLQWRQLRPVLDADADRAGLELRLIKPLPEDRLPAVRSWRDGQRRRFQLVARAMRSANRAGDPIVAEKRPDDYAINYPELQARIEIAHRPLIEVNDAARR